ncbi:MAG: hypothetical protein AUK47_29060 [Deltaproteobacteria bacterium CG2_30_63_29]|nr:MAG: hypothetical protein AUK47_29060 [Deltaproteobacteria bacterium CG2_30_63_29]PJB45616.1 MAG: hypothetical protein CO108_07000 [Deltaproteobacteria bacterium CG_4_9_14_3_um_filter_63_12]
MVLLGNVLAAILLLIGTSSMLLAIGVNSWVVHSGIIAAVYVSMRRPFHEGAITMLIVCFVADGLASGPPGLHALLLCFVFFVVFGIAQRVGGRFLMAMFVLSFGASITMDLAEAMLVSLFYPDVDGLRIFLRTALQSATVTGLLMVPYAMTLNAVERFWRSKMERNVVVD